MQLPAMTYVMAQRLGTERRAPYTGTKGRAPARPQQCPAFQQSLPRSILRVSQCTYPDEEDKMASSGKRKTTMAKLNRERKLVERRLEKKAKKEARKLAAAQPSGPPAAEALGADE